MLETFPGTATSRPPAWRGLSLALLFHALLIAGAVTGTNIPDTGIPPASRDTIWIEMARVRFPSMPPFLRSGKDRSCRSRPEFPVQG